ncbi:MAG TPA: hypothetical protein VK184_26865 [Nostocaceae cyanobacterium]|nr:hypothetical protein [Nostocaceae cyanobacterium]
MDRYICVDISIIVENLVTATCKLIKIESIYINDVLNQEIRTKQGMEVGLKFNIDARKDLQLYQLNFYPK